MVSVEEAEQRRMSSPAQQRLKIMTFNVRFAGANDGLNGWDYRKDHVADIINRYRPAIIGTQEGLKSQLTELEGLLAHPYKRFGVEREKNGEFVQIFYDTTVVECLDDGNFWLSESPDTPWTKGWDAANVRMVTWGKFRLCITHQEFFVFNTHLDHVGLKSHEEGSKLLHERIEKIAGRTPLFLLGDFNSYRHTCLYKYLTSQKEGPRLNEAWSEATIQIGDVSHSFHDWAGIKSDTEKDTIRGANHIDWIFYRPQMTVLTTQVIIEDRNGRYPSDHYPVQAEVIIPAPEEASLLQT
ncbi:Endonuclease/exonuclease/phosphatase [Plasmopara halstedii]|uniref:Endonuclease/exonuclease/phosphatase n=1 Tax=Plasmopara halstedii TaxID=4781 RepID=A0A0P1ANA6_PLAHL|nr:Endonuclease/exonuclease/phosphatase [Plasmopara halstedii]CEG42860.1 Endonuclease/exonuclease/phosphatase [Plasmopara halstedii]|eukprot:XP_024579229.1 Endonuclease/exonuclease/phosphatase [Plasmopara halstedii]